MFRPFNASCMTIGELLGGEMRFAIPGYQRAYAWTAVQAAQLLDDILLALDETPASSGKLKPEDDYFLGAVVLMQVDRNGQASDAAPVAATHEIVDGLQRLVTVTILLAVLRDVAADDDPEAAARAAHCIVEPADGDRPEADRLRLNLAGETSKFFFDFVQQAGASSAMPADDDLPAPEARLLAVREHLMANLIGEGPARRRQLLDYLLSSCHCAVISARTLDRAHHIFAVLNDRGLPLSRGDILKAQILGALPPERRSELDERWRDVEQKLGGSLEDLFSHLRTIEGRSRARILDEIRALVERSGSAGRFVESTLFPYAEILDHIRNAPRGETRLPASVWGPLRYLGWLGNQDWIAPLMLYWRRVEGDASQIATFLARLERLAYGLRLLGVGSDKRASRYRAVLDAIRTDRLDSTTSPIELTRDEQRLIAYNLRMLHARSQLTCKLVLLRLNDLLAGAPQHLDPASFTVEHILPQKPARAGQWREWFPKAEERERWTQSIGNLILVSRDENDRARNLELASKLEIYFGDDPQRQPLITRDVEGAEAWRPEDVRKREERLTALLNAHWRLGVARGVPQDEVSGQKGRSAAPLDEAAPLAPPAAAAE
ncbi:MAG: DUF262 domain-containing HNH endonuclease family protein [Hyphomicrobiaceae bacterium]